FCHGPIQRNALRNFLKLPEVQQDITELATKPSTYPIMLDIHDGEFARTHPVFKTRDLLKIELNSDGLNITNAISNHIHKTFLFYWSLLNLRRDPRSLQASKRLVVACPEDDLTANVLQQITSKLKFADFVRCLQQMAKDGVDVVINGARKIYQVALFFTSGDYPAQQTLHGRKESVSALKFCPCCNVTNDDYKDNIDQLPAHYTNLDYEQACKFIEECVRNGDENTTAIWRKFYGINNRSIFAELPNFDVTLQVLLDPMHILLQGVCKYHLNAFLQHCVDANRFTMAQFCLVINEFSFDVSENLSKPCLNMRIEELRNSTTGLPLDAMQTYHLSMNLPFILRKLLKNSTFPAYDAILLLVDIVNLIWASEADDQTVLQLQKSTLLHNKLYKQLYPDKLKQKFHFLLHLPRQMKLFGPHRFITTLASERKHQYFKGQKMHYFKNAPLTLTKRLQAWESVKDYNSDGTLPTNIFKHETVLHHVETLTDDLRINVDKWTLPAMPTHTATRIKYNSISYSVGTVICASQNYLEENPIFLQIMNIFIIKQRPYFACTQLNIIRFDENVRSSEVKISNDHGSVTPDFLRNVWPLKLVNIDNVYYVDFRPHGRTFTQLLCIIMVCSIFYEDFKANNIDIFGVCPACREKVAIHTHDPFTMSQLTATTITASPKQTTNLTNFNSRTPSPTRYTSTIDENTCSLTNTLRLSPRETPTSSRLTNDNGFLHGKSPGSSTIDHIFKQINENIEEQTILLNNADAINLILRELDDNRQREKQNDPLRNSDPVILFSTDSASSENLDSNNICNNVTTFDTSATEVKEFIQRCGKDSSFEIVSEQNSKVDDSSLVPPPLTSTTRCLLAEQNTPYSSFKFASSMSSSSLSSTTAVQEQTTELRFIHQ
ncbi:unnamed protein product, partial [Didymodactylos carnosus]